MRLLKKLTGLLNIGLRGSSLAFRFLLSFYILKYLGYEQTGVYGLAVGLIGIVPALIGWGLNNVVSRDIVGVKADVAVVRVKTRLMVTIVSLIVLTIISVVALYAAGYSLNVLYLFILALLWFETLAVDIHMALIGQEKAIEANILVFIRLGLWVPFAIGLGILYPAFRSLEFVFFCWAASHLLSWAVLWFFARRLPLRTIAKEPIQYDWLKDKFRSSRLIYLSDLGIVGLVYADRYVVGYILGLTLTGIYTFYWSLANALQTLVATAVVQLALPAFVKAYRDGPRSKWYEVMRKQFIKTAIVTPILGICIFVCSQIIIIHFMSMKELGEHNLLFIMLLLAAVIRCCSDLLNIGLISAGADARYVSINVSGVFVSLLFAAVGSVTLGLDGVGYGSLVAAILLLLARILALKTWMSKETQAEAA